MAVNETYITNDFLTNLYRQIQPEQTLLDCSIEDMDKVREKKKQTLRELLKLAELEQVFGIELSYEQDNSELTESMGMAIVKYNVHAVEGLDMPVYHVKPNSPNGKTILYLHGHDDLGIQGALLDRTDKVRYHKIIPVKLAKEGYDVIAPELIGLGEAGFYGFPKGEEKMCGCLINERYLALAGFSLAGFRAYQTRKTLDFIEQLGLAEDITAFGISGGGMTCQHVFAIEERIKRAIVACYTNTYMDSILAKEHCVDNYMPGLLRIGDSYQLLALAAPKPLFTVNGLWDKGFPKAGSEIAFEYIEKVYHRLGAEDQYESKLIEGRHEIDEQTIIDWLKRNV